MESVFDENTKTRMEKIKVYFNDKELNNIGQKLKKLFPSYFKRFTDLKYSSIEKRI